MTQDLHKLKILVTQYSSYSSLTLSTSRTTSSYSSLKETSLGSSVWNYSSIACFFCPSLNCKLIYLGEGSHFSRLSCFSFFLVFLVFDTKQKLSPLLVLRWSLTIQVMIFLINRRYHESVVICINSNQMRRNSLRHDLGRLTPPPQKVLPQT